MILCIGQCVKTIEKFEFIAGLRYYFYGSWDGKKRFDLSDRNENDSLRKTRITIRRENN